jgi:hypothetical protein
MWCQVSGNEVIRVIPSPIALTVDSIQYPRNIFTVWSASELKNIGIYPYSETVPNTTYHTIGSVSYNVGADAVTGTYATTDQDYAELKKGMLKQTKITAGNILLRDDWMSIREAEGGTAMPDNIKTYRAAIRTESGKKEDEINALSDLDAVKLYEATPYTYVYKVKNVDGTHGPTTESITWHINLVEHYEASDPLAEVDPAFVSLEKE